jgi:hypothetical protein
MIWVSVLSRRFAAGKTFNSELGDELLSGEVFSTLHEAKVLMNAGAVITMPSDRIGYRPPAPEAILRRASGLSYAALRSVQTLADGDRLRLNPWYRN